MIEQSVAEILIEHHQGATSSRILYTNEAAVTAIFVERNAVTVSEVEALYELYKKIISSITNDRLIHKNRNLRNLFVNKIVVVYDFKRN